MTAWTNDWSVSIWTQYRLGFGQDQAWKGSGKDRFGQSVARCSRVNLKPVVENLIPVSSIASLRKIYSLGVLEEHTYQSPHTGDGN